MQKNYCYLIFWILTSFFSLEVAAQAVTLSGTVKDATTQQGLPAVSLTVRGSTTVTFTDGSGNFHLRVSQLPVTLIFSSVGYETSEITVDHTSASIQVLLNTGSSLGQEVVVAATRTPQRILESPVSIE